MYRQAYVQANYVKKTNDAIRVRDLANLKDAAKEFESVGDNVVKKVTQEITEEVVAKNAQKAAEKATKKLSAKALKNAGKK